MVAFSTIALAILYAYTTTTSVTNTIVLDDLASYLTQDMTFNDMIKKGSKTTKNDYECDKDIRVPLSSGAYDVDTKDEACGWEFASISVTCNVVGVGSIGFTLRNVLNESSVKNVNVQNKFMAKRGDVPANAWVTSVSMGYTQNFASTNLVSLAFSLSNGMSLNFSCGRAQTNTVLSLGAYERITGLYGFTSYGALKSISFYVSRVVQGDEKFKNLGSRPNPSYKDVVAKIKQTDSTPVQDKFVLTELVGTKTGQRFEDPYFYGHWKISSLMMLFGTPIPGQVNLTGGLGNNVMYGLTALQTTITNAFFNYSMSTEVHGARVADSDNILTVTAPEAADVSAVEFVTTTNRKIAGVRFIYTDGTNSNYVGESPYKIGLYVNRVDVGPSREFMGFWGYTSDAGVEGLGLVLVHKNDVKLFYEAN